MQKTHVYTQFDGLVVATFEPVAVQTQNHLVMLDSTYGWVQNGPNPAGVMGRGRIIKQDGSVGRRPIEVSPNYLPQSVISLVLDEINRQTGGPA